MKKLFIVSAIALLSIGTASAEVSLPKNMSNVCASLSRNGAGSVFVAAEKNVRASLWYNASTSDGISGGFSAVLHGYPIDARLSNSHCNNGHVILNWSTRSFSGTLQGDIDLYSSRIINVTGDINGESFNSDLEFRGYTA